MIEEMAALRMAITDLSLRRVSSSSGDSGAGHRALNRRPPGDLTLAGRSGTGGTTSTSTVNPDSANGVSPASVSAAVVGPDSERPVSTKRALSVGAEILQDDAVAEGSEARSGTVMDIGVAPVPVVESDNPAAAPVNVAGQG